MVLEAAVGGGGPVVVVGGMAVVVWRDTRPVVVVGGMAWRGAEKHQLGTFLANFLTKS